MPQHSCSAKMAPVRIYITVDKLGFYSAVEHTTHTCSSCAEPLQEYSIIKVVDSTLTCTECLLKHHEIAACVQCGKIRLPEHLADQRCVMCKLRVPFIDASPLRVLT
jgi:uncharacterized protein with PIN domain